MENEKGLRLLSYCKLYNFQSYEMLHLQIDNDNSKQRTKESGWAAPFPSYESSADATMMIPDDVNVL